MEGIDDRIENVRAQCVEDNRSALRSAHGDLDRVSLASNMRGCLHAAGITDEMLDEAGFDPLDAVEDAYNAEK